MAIPYTKQTWTDGAGGGTPISAARLGVLEQGVYDAHRMPTARVYHNAAQSIANATIVAVAFNSERYDTDTIHDNATNNSRLTCKTAGVYDIGCCIAFANAATGYRVAQIKLNGTTVIAGDYRGAVNGELTVCTVSTQYQLAVNDYLEVTVYQTNGVAINLNVNANFSPEFWMSRVASG